MSEDTAEVKIIEKPESVSFQEIHDLIYAAHAVNREKGVVVSTTLLDAEGTKAHLGPDGKCYVALLGDKLVGTFSYRIVEMNRWYHKGKSVDLIMIAVDPAYTGKHIFSRLYDRIMEDVAALGIPVLSLNTQEPNETMRNIAAKLGFHCVDYYRDNGVTKHYGMKLIKWLDKQPFSDGYINRKFKFKRLYVRLRSRLGI